ncbi:MAG: hypothetical protein QXI12_12130 [Candidatus Methanomethyliaceae archaeon]
MASDVYIPHWVSPYQLLWHVITEGSLSPTEEGVCRICGSPLVGKPVKHKVKDKWLDEHRIKAKNSFLICEACAWGLSDEQRKNLTKHLRGVLVIQGDKLICYDDGKRAEGAWSQHIEAKRIEEFLGDYGQWVPPYIVVMKVGDYKKHALLGAQVSWNQVPWITLLGPNINSLVLPMTQAELLRRVNVLEEQLHRGNAFSSPAWLVAQNILAVIRKAKKETSEKEKKGDGR